MNRVLTRNFAVLALVAAAALGSGSALAGDDTYYPYPMYEEYWKDEPHPPVSRKEPPEAEKHRGGAVAERPRWQSVPGFLFPKELGFGVAVGVPEDLFYLEGTYFLVREGAWYRSSSYRGPWRSIKRGKLPPVLLEHDLARVRQLRNGEFREYWEKKEKYPGRHFRPGKREGVKRPD